MCVFVCVCVQISLPCSVHRPQAHPLPAIHLSSKCVCFSVYLCVLYLYICVYICMCMRIYLCTCRQIYLLISNFCIPYVSGLTRTIIHTVYTQYFWQGNHQIYGRIRFWSTLRVCGASVCTCARARNQCTCCAGAQLQISVYHTFPFLHKFLYTSHCVWARMIRPA